MTLEEIIRSLEDQALDRDSSIDDPDCIFRHDAAALRATVERLRDPFVHARWVKPVPGDGENYCSACKAAQPWFNFYGYFEPDFCPYCGAKMDAKEETDHD